MGFHNLTSYRTQRKLTSQPSRRISLLAVFALVAGLSFVAFAAPQAASADVSAQCASPTRTVSPSDRSISVASGETVLVAADFTGGIDALPTNGALCIASGATLTGSYLNNAAGSLSVAAGGSLSLPSIAVATGFLLDVEGSAAVAGLAMNGNATIHVADGATFTSAGSIASASGEFHNEGEFHVDGALDLNTGVLFENSGILSVKGGANINGQLTNSGIANFSLGLTINGSGSLHNSCAVNALGDLMNNGGTSQNEGIVLTTGNFTNNGRWTQSHNGVSSAVGFTDDGTVTGFGRYHFTGNSSVQGTFIGDSAADPIVVQSTAPGSQLFNTQTGGVSNAMRGTVNLLVPFPACGSTTEPSPTADVEVAKDGPATVFENGVVTYTITVTNHGPSAAAGVTAYDQLPTGFTLDPASTTGTVNSGRISWSLGDLGVNETITLSFSGTATAPVGTILTNGAIASSTTPDTAPSNNDGTSESSRVSTEVIATPPPANVAPVANDLTRDTSTRLLEVGQVQASDADAGQKLTYTKATSPAHGNVYFTASGGFVYLSDADFSGFDSFDYQVCDNGTPVLCDTATVTFNVYPRAIDDNAQTFEASPVAIPLLANDIPGSQLETTITATPANGQVSVNATAGVATYVPADGFTGTDTFEYQICSLTSPQLCAIATVTVTVIAENNPPVVQPLTQITVVDSATTETVTATDPNAGDILTDESGIPPRSGSVSVDAGGTVVYTPHHGFAGRDEYTVIVCDDGTPQLCATGLVSVEILPLASPDLATTRAGTPVSIEVLTNDAGTVSAPTVASQPTNGSVSITGGTAVYTPATGFVGTDSFTYTICALEAADLCATTTATITVTAAQPGTTPPGTTQPPAHGGNASGPSTGGLAVTGANDPIAPALGWAALAAGFACIAAARSRKQRQI